MGPHGPSRYGFCLRDASVSDTAPIRTREGLPRAPNACATSAPSEHEPGGVRMPNGSAGGADDSSRRDLLRQPSGTRDGVLPDRKSRPTAVRHKRAQARHGNSWHIDCLEPTDRAAHHFPCRERVPDLRRPLASVTPIAPGRAAYCRGTPVVVAAPPLRRRAIFGVSLRRPCRGPTGAWNPHERPPPPWATSTHCFGPATRVTAEGGVA